MCERFWTTFSRRITFVGREEWKRLLKFGEYTYDGSRHFQKTSYSDRSSKLIPFSRWMITVIKRSNQSANGDHVVPKIEIEWIWSTLSRLKFRCSQSLFRFDSPKRRQDFLRPSPFQHLFNGIIFHPYLKVLCTRGINKFNHTSRLLNNKEKKI